MRIQSYYGSRPLIDLIKNLVSRDLKLKYQGSVLGFLWSLVNPLMTLIIYSWVFVILMRTPIPHFAIFLMAGILPWNFFAGSLMSSVEAFTGNASLIKKVPLPKSIFIISIISFNFVIFLMVLAILLIAMPIYGVPLSWDLLWIFVGFILEVLLLVGLGLLVGTLNVLFHDTAHLLEIALLAWFWVTPVVYSWQTVPQRFQFILQLNPMSLVVDFYKKGILQLPIHASIAIGLSEIGLFLVIGIIVYQKYKKQIAERI